MRLLVLLALMVVALTSGAQGTSPVVPVCTVAPSNAAPIIDDRITLTATCSGDPSHYSWSNCSSTTNVCQTTQSYPGTTPYTVTVDNGYSNGSATAMVSWQAPAGGLPWCTLGPTGTMLVGTKVTLATNCHNNPTSWQWQGSCTPIGDGSRCEVTWWYPGVQDYTVTPRNNVGAGPSVSTQLTWQGNPALAPVCQLSASSNVPLVGANLTLTGTCTGQPTAFWWTNCSSGLTTCTATSTQTGPVTYTLRGQNSYAVGLPVSVTVNWQGAQSVVPQCTLTANGTLRTVGDGLPMRADCTASPTSYTWTNCNSNGPNCAPYNLSTPGVQTYTVVATNASGSSKPASVSITWLPLASKTTAVEYYHAGLDHYFVSADWDERALLDTHVFAGWERTGLQFYVFDRTVTGVPGVMPVCRFYGDPAAGLDSHFYSASPAECDAVKRSFPQWIFESDNVFGMMLPDMVTGACPTDYQPLYRAWNHRADSNHRYTTDPVVQAQMIAKGYVAEGYGNPPVAMCVAKFVW